MTPHSDRDALRSAVIAFRAKNPRFGFRAALEHVYESLVACRLSNSERARARIAYKAIRRELKADKLNREQQELLTALDAVSRL